MRELSLILLFVDGTILTVDEINEMWELGLLVESFGGVALSDLGKEFLLKNH